jgi:transcriptional regulator with XRE-family HTH domain
MPENPDLKQWREERHLSQARLAELLPVNLRTLQEWEAARGKGQPPPFLWRALEHLDSELGKQRRGRSSQKPHKPKD